MARRRCKGKQKCQPLFQASTCIKSASISLAKARHLAKPRDQMGEFWKVTALSMDAQGESSEVITESIYQRKEVRLIIYTLNCNVTAIPALMELPELS